MAQRWIDIFALSQFSASKLRLSYSDRTVRVIIRNFISGDKIRVTLANRYGRKNIPFHKVTAAMCNLDGIFIGTPATLLFNGEEHGFIGAKSSITSDDIALDSSEGYIAISIFFKGRTKIGSVNFLKENVIVSEKGDFTLSKSIQPSGRLIERMLNKFFDMNKLARYKVIPALESVSVFSSHDKGAVIAFGDSITQGGMWSYTLAEKLKSPVLNMGISGNRLLRDCNMPIVKGLLGEAALKRFDRDVLTRQGAKAVIVLLGTNDIGQPGSPAAKKDEAVTADDLIRGYIELGKRIKAAGLKGYICTLTPFRHYRMGYIGDSFFIREQINSWIRENKIFDGYYDFDKMICTEGDDKLQPEYDSGDHLHPSDQGSIKMVDAIDIEKLSEVVKIK